ncbi:MAG: hypothetical protein K6F88_00345 [Ruminococcus sp.]|nr:hypothetical protein [Ruminococcus sp.]
MKEKLLELLSTFGYEIFLQGSLNKEKPYPDTFFTFWNNNTVDGNHYDNDAISYVWSFTVNFYSTDPELTNSVLLQARTLLKQNDWIVDGKGYDVPVDEPTHTGRAIDVLYLEMEDLSNA